VVRLKSARASSIVPGVKTLAAVLAAVVTALLPLAHSSPVDPTWCPGFWDNGDFDDAILFLTSGLQSLDTSDQIPVVVADAVSERVFEQSVGIVAQRAYEPGIPRAPPTS